MNTKNKEPKRVRLSRLFHLSLEFSITKPVTSERRDEDEDEKGIDDKTLTKTKT